MATQPWWKGSRGEWYVVVQFILLGLVALAPLLPVGHAAWPQPLGMIARAAGLLLGAGGAALAVVGVLGLGRNLSALPHPKEGAFFVEQGAYRLVRHPIYSGLTFGCLGWALLTNSLAALALAVVVLAFFDLKSRREERWLMAKFPEYAGYRRRVRKLIPYLY